MSSRGDSKIWRVPTVQLSDRPAGRGGTDRNQRIVLRRETIDVTVHGW